MRRVLVVFAAVVFLPAALARPDAESYAPKDGGYTVKFPGRPREGTQRVKSPRGVIEVRMADYANNKGDAWVAAYYDHPDGAGPADEAKRVIDAVVNEMRGDGKVTKNEEIEFGDKRLPALAFTIEKPKQQFVRGVVVMSGARVYQVFVLGSKSFVESKDAKAFLDSFTLTK